MVPFGVLPPAWYIFLMTDSTPANASDAIQSIVSSDNTTSAKIRSLAALGLARTEIRDLLGVRYQHVRKVLVDAGISDGLVRSRMADDEPRVQAAVAPPVEAVPWRMLLSYGFKITGQWTLAEDGIQLDGLPPGEPGVYAFILDDQIVYVGLTQTALKTRMGHYRLGHSKQKTSARVKKLIQKSLADGGEVVVLTCVPGELDWNGLSLQLGPSLEASLISLIHPLWNIQGKRRRA